MPVDLVGTRTSLVMRTQEVRILSRAQGGAACASHRLGVPAGDWFSR